ncbi:MAG TPA: hypothetical protein VKR30_12215 [Candidatus Limnocylindrales bacterium]|nr:hypothetical protein [Candidatus Limnocylindrales bacterium]
MAVYQGARRRPAFELPWLRPDRESRPAIRRSVTPAGTRTGSRARGASRATARPGIRGQRRVATILSGIVILFSLAFVQLSQTVRVSATSYDVVRLQAEHDRLVALQQDLVSNVERLNGEPAIRQEGLDAGLGQLGAPVVLPVVGR